MLFLAYNYLIKIVDIDANWFSDLFKGEYKNVMNNVTQYVSHGYAGKDNGSHIGYIGGSTDDSNAEDDSDNDNSNKDDDDAGDSF